MQRYFLGLLVGAFCSIGFSEQAGAAEIQRAMAGKALHCIDGNGNSLNLWAGKNIHGDLTIQQSHGPAARYQINLGPQYGRDQYDVLSAYPAIAPHNNGEIHFDHPTSFLNLGNIQNAYFRLTHEGSMHEKIVLYLQCSP